VTSTPFRTRKMFAATWFTERRSVADVPDE
jgi:hypothetical protein